MDLLGGDPGNVTFPGMNQPFFGGGVLSPAQAFGAALMAAGGPSRVPLGLFPAIGEAMTQAQKTNQEGARNLATTGLLGQEYRQKELANEMAQQRWKYIQQLLGGTAAGPQGAQPQDSPAAGSPSTGAPGGSPASPLLGPAQPAQGGASPSLLGAGVPGDLLQRALLADMLVPGAGKEMIAKGVPNFQENVRPGGYVTQLGPDGRPHTVYYGTKLPEGAVPTVNGGVAFPPGALNAIGAAAKAEAGGKAAYEPMTVYDAAGNEYTVPRSALGSGGGVRANAPTIPPPPTLPQAPSIPPVTPIPSASPSASSPQSANPVTFPGPQIPQNLDQFLGPNYSPPSRPTPPNGAFMGKPGAGMEAIAKQDADRLEGYQKELAGGQKIYTNLQQMYDIIGRGLSTGKMTEAATNLASLAQQSGYANLVPKNFDPNDANAFNKLATDLIFTSLKQLPGQPRVAEIEGLRQANPGLAMTPAANTEILNSILADQRWKDARAGLAKQYMTRYGNLGDFDTVFNRKVPETDVFNSVQDAATKAGWKLPGSPGTPSGGPVISDENMAKATAIRENFNKGMYGDPKSDVARKAATAKLRELGFQ